MQGLTNIGNTCYMNSALQMLYKLEQFMLDIDQIYTTSKDNSFLVTYYFMETYYSMNNHSIKPEWLNQFRQVICTQYQQFKLNEQQDAQEFLLALLDMLHSELRNPNCQKMPTFEYKQEGDLVLTSLISFIEFEGSPIVKHFGTILKTQITCQYCNCKNYVNLDSNTKLEVSFSLQLTIGSNSSNIQELLQNSFKPEEVKMKCEVCNQERKFQKRTTVIKFTKSLLICLNRYKMPGVIDRFFIGNQISKSNKQIQLNKQMILGTNKKLCGIIDHSGNKDKGHYQYLYLSGDDWVCFNDAKIALLTEESIQKIIYQNETSYILLYSENSELEATLI